MARHEPLTPHDIPAVTAALQGYSDYLARQGKDPTESQWPARVNRTLADYRLGQVEAFEPGDAWEPPEPLTP